MIKYIESQTQMDAEAFVHPEELFDIFFQYLDLV